MIEHQSRHPTQSQHWRPTKVAVLALNPLFAFHGHRFRYNNVVYEEYTEEFKKILAWELLKDENRI